MCLRKTSTKSAYEQLWALKRDDESFSDLVERLTESTDPLQFAGSCRGLAEHVKAARSDLEATNDELFG